MKKALTLQKNLLLTVLILMLSFGMSLLMQKVFLIEEHITTLFVFAVFLISLVTDGYTCGVSAAVVSMLLVNYAFTAPFFMLNFTIRENLFSAVVMIVIALLTSTLTTKVRRQEAIKAESEKERMRANLLRAISHDLRTPLTTIFGSSTALLEEGDRLSEEQKVSILRGIREDADWLVRMVENLLSITRIDSGRVRIQKTSTVLEELVDSVLVKFRARCPHQPVLLDLPEELVLIPMDALLIEQVLLNLLDNAVKHAQGMTCLSLKVFTLGDQAIFEVADNGCGIPADRLPSIFSGTQAQDGRPADSNKRSAGIGLSVCATIIKAHGGHIRAENARDGGAIFRFDLALEEESHEQQV